jgi:hypothetical protein
MRPGDRPSVPLEEEPALFLHPVATGAAVPGGVQPVRGGFGLEEEPALWPSVRGSSAPALPSRLPAGRAATSTAHGTARGTAGGTAWSGVTLAATGGGLPPVAGAAILGLAAVLRLRSRRLQS